MGVRLLLEVVSAGTTKGGSHRFMSKILPGSDPMIHKLASRGENAHRPRWDRDIPLPSLRGKLG